MLRLFPSPQGGSETTYKAPLMCRTGQFPSPQGGSETINAHKNPTLSQPVSIPSRRVGDGAVEGHLMLPHDCFHPLKAGRRPDTYWESLRIAIVSIPSRRVGDCS